MSARFSSAFSAWTRSWVVLIAFPQKVPPDDTRQPQQRNPSWEGLNFGRGQMNIRSVFNHPIEHSMQPTLIRKDTMAWKAQVWISFGTAATLCATGLAYLPGEDIQRAFMVMGYVFCLSTAFALAKYIRD